MKFFSQWKKKKTHFNCLNLKLNKYVIEILELLIGSQNCIDIIGLNATTNEVQGYVRTIHKTAVAQLQLIFR